MKKSIIVLSCLIMVIVLVAGLVGCSTPAPTTTAPTTPGVTTPGATTPKPTTPAVTTPATTKPATTPAANVMKWKFHTHLQPTEMDYKVLSIICDDVNLMTDGQIEITIYPAAAIVPATEQMDAVGKNAIQMQYSTGSYNAGTSPELDTETGMPMTWKGLDDMLVILYERGFEDLIRKTYAEKYNNHLIGLVAVSGLGAIFSKPINSYADFKGLKIRTFGSLAKWFETMGATPVYVPGNEIYTGLQLGTFQAATWGAENGMAARGLHEVAKYFLVPKPVVTHQNAISMNLDLWKSLSPKLQKIVTSVVRNDSITLVTKGLAEDARIWSTVMVPAGCKYNYMGPEDITKMTTAAETVWTDIAKKSPRAKEAVGIVTDYLRDKGYTTYDVKNIQ
ncbi:MAG: TRAP transporter substrate-binding protein DctP [Dehalococcoidales bacterium]|nr:TRAP transporter substrate-binding protein DctP [Dehalococcoidales bacterium]